MTREEKVFAVIFRELIKNFAGVSEPDLMDLSEKLAEKICKVI